MVRRGPALIAGLVGLVVMLATALAVVVAQGGQGQPETLSGVPTPDVVVDANAIGRSVPVLTVSQQQEILDVATSEMQASGKHDALRDGEADVSDVVVWHDSSGQVLGGVVTWSLSSSRTVDDEWLGLAWGCGNDEAKNWVSEPYRAEFAEVSSVLIFIDLQRHEVASIGPNPDTDAQLVGDVEVDDGSRLVDNDCQSSD